MLPCRWWWNGSGWQKIAGFCPVGQHCQEPEGQGNPGEFRSTDCVDD